MIFNKKEIERLYNLGLSKVLMSYMMDKKEDFLPASIVSGYPFSVDDIRCIYTLHLKKGIGTWFYLLDGSIWNENGLQEQSMAPQDFI